MSDSVIVPIKSMNTAKKKYLAGWYLGMIKMEVTIIINGIKTPNLPYILITEEYGTKKDAIVKTASKATMTLNILLIFGKYLSVFR